MATKTDNMGKADITKPYRVDLRATTHMPAISSSVDICGGPYKTFPSGMRVHTASGIYYV